MHLPVFLRPSRTGFAVLLLLLSLAVAGPALAADADGDGVDDAADLCPASNLAPNVVLAGCDSGVANHVLADGCSLMDVLASCVQRARNHGEFVSCARAFTRDASRAGVISHAESQEIQRCAAQSDLPGEDAPAVGVTVSFPQDGAVLSDRAVSIGGTVAPLPAAPRVEIAGFAGTVFPDGQFLVSDVPLLEGSQTLTVRVFDGAAEVASAQVTVSYVRPAAAAVEVDPATGGTAEVTDPDSPLFGAAITIPVGAATRSLRAVVTSEPEHVPNLPVGEIEVGPAITFGPEGEVFAAPVLLRLPVDPAALPAGVGVQDVYVRGFGDAGWELLPVVAAEADGVVVEVDRLWHTPVVAAVDLPLAAGELLIDTRPANATLYLDRADTGRRSPLLLAGVASGSHEIKAYVPGFNEAFSSFEMTAEGRRLEIELGVPQAPVPVVTLDSSLVDGMQVAASFIDVTAQVDWDGAPLAGGVAVLAINGRDTFETIGPDGSVHGAVALFPGDNVLQVRANGPNGSTGVSPTIHVVRAASATAGLTAAGRVVAAVEAAESQDITVALSWNTDDTDLDLHLFDPQGNHAWYGSLGGIPGGALDRDDVDGFGPEVFTLPSPPPGTYRVAVDSYRIDGVPTTGTLTIQVGDREEFSASYTFTGQDFNATNGQPGGSPAAFWDAHSFEIGELVVTRVETVETSPADEAIFTTHPDEAAIRVFVQAPATVADGDIRFEIEETEEGFMIDTASLMGREVVFQADHEPLMGLTNPRFSHNLRYEIVAYTLDENGERDLESEPFVVLQEERSQIRQEYVDKRDFNAAFVRVTPARGSILDAGGFVQAAGENFTFQEFSQYSDFGPGLAVIDASRTIANTLRDAWGNPLRITSGWRNPRRNDSLAASDVNSFHQTGDAVDFNPSNNPASWPSTVAGCLDGATITTYAQAQAALTCLARDTFDDATYDVLFHANHLHVERDP